MARRSAMTTDGGTTKSPGGKKKDGTFEIAIDLGGLSVGKTSISFGFTGAFGGLDPADIHASFCNARLQATIQLDEDQRSLPGMAPEPINTVLDCKRVSMGEIDFSGRLILPTGDTDIKQLAQYHNKSVRMIAKKIGSATTEDDGDSTREAA